MCAPCIVSVVTAVLLTGLIISSVAINMTRRVRSNSVAMTCNLGAGDTVEFSKRMDCLEMTTMAWCSPKGDNSTISRVQIVFPGLRVISATGGRLACATDHAEMDASAPSHNAPFSAHVWPEKGRGYTIEYIAAGWIVCLVFAIFFLISFMVCVRREMYDARKEAARR